MTTTMKETKTKSAKTDKRDQIVEELGQLTLLGEIICWSLPDNRGITNSHTSVVNALKAQGLDEKIARAFLPAQAFNRACNTLREERVIDVIRNDKDDILFQFSKRQVTDDVEEGGNEFLYQKEVKILLNKTTGELTCKNPVIKEQAKKELDRCMEARTTSDVSNIVTKLFEQQADLIPIGTGVYFVPQEHGSFTDKIANFLKDLGRKIQRFPVPAGTQKGDSSVTEAMESHFNNLIEGLQNAVDSFSVVTRDSTIANTVEKINAYRSKIEAYSTYLQDRKDGLMNVLAHAEKVLMAKVEILEEERQNAPVNQGGSNRQRVFGCLNGTPKTVKQLCREAGCNTNGIKTYLDAQVSDGKVVRKGEGYRLANAWL